MDKFEALYVVNKSAKKYINVNNRPVRSEALYKLKHTLINDWINGFEKAEEHIIRSKKYYCLFSSNHAFHIPEDKLYYEPEVEVSKKLENFSSKPTNEIGISEKMALMYIYDNFNISPNRFISKKDQSSIWGYIPK